MTVADLEYGLPARVRLSDEDFRKACVHEAGHVVVGYLLAAETRRNVIDARVFREVTKTGDGGWTVFHQIPSVNFTKKAYLAQITVLLAGESAPRLKSMVNTVTAVTAVAAVTTATSGTPR